MKTVNHLSVNPSVHELMEVAYDEGRNGEIFMSAELERVIEDTYPGNDQVWQRVNDAHYNGVAEYRAECVEEAYQ